MNIDFTETKLEDVIKDKQLADYQERCEKVSRQLFRLNTNLFIVEQILSFPFGLFTTSEDDRKFFRNVTLNLLDTSVLAITKLLTDKKNGLLGKLRNVIELATNKTYRARLEKALAPIKMEQLKKKTEKLIVLRDKWIAHADNNFPIPPTDKERVDVRDILKLRDELNNLFEILTFGPHYPKLPLPYRQDRESPSDIERILDSVAANSPLFNAPEKDLGWSYLREAYSVENIKQLNFYRKKLGKTEV